MTINFWHFIISTYNLLFLHKKIQNYIASKIKIFESISPPKFDLSNIYHVENLVCRTFVFSNIYRFPDFRTYVGRKFVILKLVILKFNVVPLICPHEAFKYLQIQNYFSQIYLCCPWAKICLCTKVFGRNGVLSNRSLEAKINNIYGFPFCATTIEILDLEQVYWHRSCKHFGQKNLVKSLLISTLDKVIYYIHWNIFTGLNKTSLHYTK
jgi:hypothetical protein